MMSNQSVIRAAYYLRISTEEQELDNQRAEIMPFIERRGWKLVHPFEDVMSGRKAEKDRPGFAAMLKAAHHRFDILVFWALDRLTREGTRATLNYLQRLESKGVGYVSYQEQWLALRLDPSKVDLPKFARDFTGYRLELAKAFILLMQNR
jgi:DNA invertase Pin-like site-specific DNA recombinase